MLSALQIYFEIIVPERTFKKLETEDAYKKLPY